MISKRLQAIATAISEAGGRAILVGGFVRDRLLGLPAKDIDFEVFGLDVDALAAVLSRFGKVNAVGRAFGVLRISGFDVDFSLPRRDSKTAPGHRGFEVSCEPDLDFSAAARRRDLTINSIGLDPLTGALLDPHGGQRDLEAGLLRATDARHFSEDPLRGVRVAQFAARFEMQPNQQLLALCAALDLSELSAERIFEELRKLLLKGRKPSLGLTLLRDTGLLRFFPELQALVGVPQDPKWHQEGDVWIHTLMVVDAAAKLRGDADDLAFMFAALCHDLGKSEVTVEQDGRIRSPDHETVGARLTEGFMSRLCAPKDLTRKVCALVQHHGAPFHLVREEATAKAYRRLARKLDPTHTSLELLAKLARADHLGRTADEAKSGPFAVGDTFLQRAREAAVAKAGSKDVVLGRHLLARGFSPGESMGELLHRCRDVQDETGWSDPERILNQVLSDEPAP